MNESLKILASNLLPIAILWLIPAYITFVLFANGPLTYILCLVVLGLMSIISGIHALARPKNICVDGGAYGAGFFAVYSICAGLSTIIPIFFTFLWIIFFT